MDGMIVHSSQKKRTSGNSSVREKANKEKKKGRKVSLLLMLKKAVRLPRWKKECRGGIKKEFDLCWRKGKEVQACT